MVVVVVVDTLRRLCVVVVVVVVYTLHHFQMLADSLLSQVFDFHAFLYLAADEQL